MKVLQPISVETLSSLQDLVIQSIRDAILQGRFKPGEKLIQEELARQLSVSRQPVREALRRLESEGLVVNVPRRGVFVREYCEEDVHEIYLLRKLLETEATRLAAQKLEPDDWDELDRINEDMDAAVESQDAERFVDLNRDFHHLIYEACDSPRMVQFISQLWGGYTVYTPVFLPGRAGRSVSEHRRIAEALRDRDGEAAYLAMKEHIGAAADDFFEYRQGRAVPSGA